MIRTLFNVDSKNKKALNILESLEIEAINYLRAFLAYYKILDNKVTLECFKLDKNKSKFRMFRNISSYNSLYTIRVYFHYENINIVLEFIKDLNINNSKVIKTLEVYNSHSNEIIYYENFKDLKEKIKNNKVINFIIN